jgi:MFS family permease
MFSRNAETVLVVVLAVSLQLSVGELSGIASAFLLVYATLQLPSGVLADILGPRRSPLRAESSPASDRSGSPLRRAYRRW